MSKIGALSVRITADTSNLESGMKRAGSAVKRGSAQIRKNINEWTKWGAVAAAAAAAVAVAIYKSTSQSIDQLAKTADRLGLTTEALAGLRFAAEQTGVSTQTLDMALQRMTRRVAEAAQGTGEAVNALKELGIDAQNLSAMTPDQMLATLSDALEGVESQSDKVRIAMKLFDSEGVALLNTLDGGSAVLDGFRKEAEALGLTISRVDAAKVEAANDSMRRVMMAIEGVATTATARLAPSIEAIAELFADAATEADGFNTATKDIAQNIEAVAGLFGDVMRGWQLLFKGATALSSQLIADGIQHIQRFMALVQSRANDVIDMVNELGRAAGAVGLEIDPIDPLVLSGMEEMTRLTKSSQAAARRAKEEFADLSNQPLPSDQIKAFADEARKASQEAAEAVVKAQETVAKMTFKPIEFEQGGSDSGVGGVLTAAMDETEKAQAEYQKQLEILEQARQRRLEIIENYDSQEQALKEAQAGGQDVSSDLQSLQAERQKQLEELQKYQEAEAEITAQHQENLRAIKQDGEMASPAENESFIESLKERFATEAQLEQEKFAEEQARLQEALAQKATTYAEFLQLQAELESAHNDKMAEIKAEADENAPLDPNSPEGIEAYIKAIEERMAAEEEMELARYEAQLQRLREALESQKITREEYNAAMADNEAAHADKMARIKEAEEKAKAEATNKGGKGLLGALKSFGEQSTKIQKAVSLAQAGMAIATGIAEAQRLGFPAAIPEMARVASVGASVASSLKSSSVGSYSAPSAAGGGGGRVTSALAQSNSGQQSNPSNNVTVNLTGSGNGFTAQDIRNLIEQINSQTDDGVSLAVGGG